MMYYRIVLTLLTAASWLSSASASVSTKIHMVAVADEHFQSKYQPLFERMESYANHHGYFWHIISGENEGCQNKFKEFFFRKHCIVADWAARETNLNDRIFVFDADVVPFRHQTPIHHWADMPDDLIFYDRTWNNEIMAGNYMIRNVPSALAFLHEWAEYEYQVPPGFSSADNGAIHLHMAKTLFGGSEDDSINKKLEECSSKYHTLTETVENLDPYYSYVECTRELVQAGTYSTGDMSVQIMKKNTAWTMDGVYDPFDNHHEVNEENTPLPIFHHGIKLSGLNWEEDVSKYAKYNLTIPVEMGPYIVRGQSNLEAIRGSAASNYPLVTIFQTNVEVEAETWDGAWIEDIYLPSGLEVPEGSRFQITVHSSCAVNVHYSEDQAEKASKDETLAFALVNDVWVVEDNLRGKRTPNEQFLHTNDAGQKDLLDEERMNAHKVLHEKLHLENMQKEQFLHTNDADHKDVLDEERMNIG